MKYNYFLKYANRAPKQEEPEKIGTWDYITNYADDDLSYGVGHMLSGIADMTERATRPDNMTPQEWRKHQSGLLKNFTTGTRALGEKFQEGNDVPELEDGSVPYHLRNIIRSLPESVATMAVATALGGPIGGAVGGLGRLAGGAVLNSAKARNILFGLQKAYQAPTTAGKIARTIIPTDARTIASAGIGAGLEANSERQQAINELVDEAKRNGTYVQGQTELEAERKTPGVFSKNFGVISLFNLPQYGMFFGKPAARSLAGKAGRLALAGNLEGLEEVGQELVHATELDKPIEYKNLRDAYIAGAGMGVGMHGAGRAANYLANRGLPSEEEIENARREIGRKKSADASSLYGSFRQETQNVLDQNKGDAELRSWADKISGGQMSDGVFNSIVRNAQEFGIDPKLALAQATAESEGRQGVTSPAGAVGVMQLLPSTARELGVDPYDTEDNIRGGMKYLRQMYDRFGDWNLALAAYNAGAGKVERYGGIPPYGETQGYVARINGFLDNAPEYKSGKDIFGAENYNMPTQSERITQQVSQLKDGWNQVIPQIGGVLRDKFKINAAISSAARSAEHNAEVGGVPTSYHIIREGGGDALDIVFDRETSQAEQDQIAEYFRNTGLFSEVLYHDVGSGAHLHLGGLKTENLKRNEQQGVPSLPQWNDYVRAVNAPKQKKTSGKTIDTNAVDKTTQEILKDALQNEQTNNIVAKNSTEPNNVFNGAFGSPLPVAKNTEAILNSIVNAPEQKQTQQETKTKSGSAQEKTVDRNVSVIRTAQAHLNDLLKSNVEGDKVTAWKLNNAIQAGNIAEAENILKRNNVEIPESQPAKEEPKKQQPEKLEQEPIKENRLPENILPQATPAQPQPQATPALAGTQTQLAPDAQRLLNSLLGISEANESAQTATSPSSSNQQTTPASPWENMISFQSNQRPQTEGQLEEQKRRADELAKRRQEEEEERARVAKQNKELEELKARQAEEQRLRQESEAESQRQKSAREIQHRNANISEAFGISLEDINAQKNIDLAMSEATADNGKNKKIGAELLRLLNHRNAQPETDKIKGYAGLQKALANGSKKAIRKAQDVVNSIVDSYANSIAVESSEDGGQTLTPEQLARQREQKKAMRKFEREQAARIEEDDVADEIQFDDELFESEAFASEEAGEKEDRQIAADDIAQSYLDEALSEPSEDPKARVKQGQAILKLLKSSELQIANEKIDKLAGLKKGLKNGYTKAIRRAQSIIDDSLKGDQSLYDNARQQEETRRSQQPQAQPQPQVQEQQQEVAQPQPQEQEVTPEESRPQVSPEEETANKPSKPPNTKTYYPDDYDTARVFSGKSSAPLPPKPPYNGTSIADAITDIVQAPVGTKITADSSFYTEPVHYSITERGGRKMIGAVNSRFRPVVLNRANVEKFIGNAHVLEVTYPEGYEPSAPQKKTTKKSKPSNREALHAKLKTDTHTNLNRWVDSMVEKASKPEGKGARSRLGKIAAMNLNDQALDNAEENLKQAFHNLDTTKDRILSSKLMSEQQKQEALAEAEAHLGDPQIKFNYPSEKYSELEEKISQMSDKNLQAEAEKQLNYFDTRWDKEQAAVAAIEDLIRRDEAARQQVQTESPKETTAKAEPEQTPQAEAPKQQEQPRPKKEKAPTRSKRAAALHAKFKTDTHPFIGKYIDDLLTLAAEKEASDERTSAIDELKRLENATYSDEQLDAINARLEKQTPLLESVERRQQEQTRKQESLKRLRERGKFINEDETDFEKIDAAFKNKMNEVVPFSQYPEMEAIVAKELAWVHAPVTGHNPEPIIHKLAETIAYWRDRAERGELGEAIRANADRILDDARSYNKNRGVGDRYYKYTEDVEWTKDAGRKLSEVSAMSTANMSDEEIYRHTHEILYGKQAEQKSSPESKQAPKQEGKSETPKTEAVKSKETAAKKPEVQITSDENRISSSGRVRDSSEIFTTPEGVQRMLDLTEEEYPDAFTNPEYTVLDPTAGEGAFTTAVLQRKLDNQAQLTEGTSLQQFQRNMLKALSTIRSIELHADNVAELKKNMQKVFADHYRAQTGEELKKNSLLFRRMQDIIDANHIQGNTREITKGDEAQTQENLDKLFRDWTDEDLSLNDVIVKPEVESPAETATQSEPASKETEKETATDKSSVDPSEFFTVERIPERKNSTGKMEPSYYVVSLNGAKLPLGILSAGAAYRLTRLANHYSKQINVDYATSYEFSNPMSIDDFINDVRESGILAGEVEQQKQDKKIIDDAREEAYKILEVDKFPSAKGWLDYQIEGAIRNKKYTTAEELAEKIVSTVKSFKDSPQFIKGILATRIGDWFVEQGVDRIYGAADLGKRASEKNEKGNELLKQLVREVKGGEKTLEEAYAEFDKFFRPSKKTKKKASVPDENFAEWIEAADLTPENLKVDDEFRDKLYQKFPNIKEALGVILDYANLKIQSTRKGNALRNTARNTLIDWLKIAASRKMAKEHLSNDDILAGGASKMFELWKLKNIDVVGGKVSQKNTNLNAKATEIASAYNGKKISSQEAYQQIGKLLYPQYFTDNSQDTTSKPDGEIKLSATNVDDSDTLNEEVRKEIQNNPVDNNDLTPQQKLIQSFGEKLGVKTTFFRNDNADFHGAHAGNASYINVNSEMPLGQVFWHESMHWLKNNNPKLYQQLVKAAGITDEQRQTYLKDSKRKDLNTDAAIDNEIIADQFEDVAKRNGLLQSIAGKNRGLIERVVQWLKDTMNKFIEFFNNPQGKLTTKQKQALADEFGKIATRLVDPNGERIFLYNRRTGNLETIGGRSMAKTTPLSEAGEIEYSFAGVKAKTASTSKLAAAKLMERRGKSRDEIFQQTGWVKGKDQMWRFEIPDDLDKIDFGKLTRNGNTTLGEIYDLPKLYEAYPFLRDIPVSIGKSELETAHFDPEKWEIVYTKQLLEQNLEYAKEALPHEIQHAIQEYEDFARGSSPEEAGGYERYMQHGGEQEAREVQERARTRNPKRAKEFERAKKEYDTAKKAFDRVMSKQSPAIKRKINEYRVAKDSWSEERIDKLAAELPNDVVETVDEFDEAEIDFAYWGEGVFLGTPVIHDDNAIIVYGGEERSVTSAALPSTSDNSSESLTQKIRNAFSSWWKGGAKKNRNREITDLLYRVTGYKVDFGNVKDADKTIIDDVHKVIRAKHAYEWDKLLPQIGGKIAKSLKLNPTEEMSNYIADWCMTGAVGNSSTEAKAFEKAMRNDPVTAGLMLQIRESFQEFNDMTAEQKIGSTIVSRLQGKSPREIARTLWSDKEEEISDDLHPVLRQINDMVAKAEKTSPTLAKMMKEDINPYQMMRLLRGIGGLGDLMIGTEKVKDIEDVRDQFRAIYPRLKFDRLVTLDMIVDMAGGKKHVDGLMKYAVAKLDKEMHEKLREDPEADIRPQFSEAVDDEVIKNGEAQYAEAHRALVTYSNILLCIQHDAGLIGDRAFTKAIKGWKNYIPMIRVFEDDKEFTIEDSLKHKTGSQRSTYNPLETLAQNTYDILSRAERNKAKQQLAFYARIGEFGDIIQEVETSNPSNNVITFREGGKIKYLKVFDPAVKRAVDNIYSPADTSWIMKSLRATMSLVRNMRTMGSPDFAIGNLFRDMQDAYIHNRHADVNPLKALLDVFREGFKGFGFKRLFSEKSLVPHDTDWAEFNALGGTQSTFVSEDVDQLRRSMNKLTRKTFMESFKEAPLHTVLDRLQWLSEQTEYMTRLNSYKRAKAELAKQHGGNATLADKRLAALEARDASIDFAKAGTSTRKVNQLLMFANAQVQDWAKWGVIGRDYFKGGEARKVALQKVGRLVLTGVVATLLQAALNRSDDDRKEKYKKRPDWEKETYWIFGDGVRIPKGQDIATRFVSALTDEFIDKALDDDPVSGKRLLKVIRDAVPSIIPSLIEPAYEVRMNYSAFRDAPIVPVGQQRLDKAEQYGRYTSSFAKLFSEMTGLTSPRGVDYLISGYLGSTGRFFTQLPDYMFGRGMTLNDVLMVRRFVFDPAENTKTVKEYYEAYDEQYKHYNTYKLRRKWDKNAKPHEDFDPKLFTRLKSAQDSLQNISKKENEILRNPKLDWDTKNKKIRELEKKREKICEKIMQRAR